MSDFLDHSDFPKIAWSKAVNVPTGSSIAPGPPSKSCPGLTKPRTKVSTKLAAQLGNFETSPEPSSHKTCSSSSMMDQHNGGLSADTLTNAAHRGDIDGWDPMAFDHQSRTFNSYQDGGLGSVMQNCKESSTKTINLYVNKIPAAITKDGLRKLFSKAGKVNRVYLQKAKTGQSHTFGFVEFGTIKEASTAIQLLNNFDMGDGIGLVVKVSETPEQKESRQAKEQSNSLFGSCDSFDDDITETAEANPLLPRYNSLAQANPEETKSAVGSVLSVLKAPTEGAESLKASSGVDDQPSGLSRSLRNSKSPSSVTRFLRNSKSPSVKSSSSSCKSSDCLPCHVCGLRTASRCAECKTPYCGRDCQRKDWSKHQSECKLIQHGVKLSSSSAFSPAPCTPPPEESKRVFEEDSDSSFDPFFADEDEKIKALMATIRVLPVETDGIPSKQVASNYTSAIQTPPHPDRVTPGAPTHCVESEIFQSASNSSQYTEAKGLSIDKILAQFDILPKPLSSIPLVLDSGQLPCECPIIIVAYRDCTHFSGILATTETRQALLTMKDFGTSSSKFEYLDGSFSKAVVYGYVDQTGSFYRIKVAFRSGDDSVVVELYDTGFRCKLRLESIFRLPEEIASIPCLRKCCSLNHIKPCKEAESGGVDFLMSLVDQKPVLIREDNVVTVPESKLQIHCCCVVSLDKQTDINEEMENSAFCITTKKGRDRGVREKSDDKPFRQPLKSPQARSEPSSSPFSAKLPVKSPQAAALSPGQQSPITSSKPLLHSSLLKPSEPLDTPPSTSETLESPYRPVHMASKVPSHVPRINETVTIIPKVVTSPSVIWAQVMHKNFSNFHKMQSDLNYIYQSMVGSSYAPCVGEMCVVKYSQDQLFYRAQVLCVNHDETINVRLVDIGHCETVSTEQLHYMQPNFRTLPKQALLFSLAGVKPPRGSQSWGDAATIFLKNKVLNRRVQVTVLSSSMDTYCAEVYDLEDPSLKLNDMLIERGLAEAVSAEQFPSTSTSASSIVGVSLSSVSLPSNQITSPIYASKERSGCLPTPDSLFSSAKSKDMGGQGVTKIPLPTTPSDGFDEESSSFGSSHVVNGHSDPTHLPPLASSRQSSQNNSSVSGGQFVGLPTPPSSDRSDSPFEKTETTPRHLTGSRPRDRGIRNTELSEGSIIVVTVTHVMHPNSFWIQQLSKPAVDKFLSMYKKIEKLSSSLTPLTSVSAGDLCLCRFSEDNQIHRGRVKSIDNETATVTYLDYGNFEDVSIDKLYAIDQELLTFNQQGVLCTCNQLLNPAGKGADWDSRAVDFFKKMTLHQEVEMKVVKCMGLKHVVEIYVQTDDGKRNMLDLLIEKGLAMTLRGGGKSRGHTLQDKKLNDRHSDRFTDGQDRNHRKLPSSQKSSLSSPFTSKRKDESDGNNSPSSWGNETETPPETSQSSGFQHSPEKEPLRLSEQRSLSSSSSYPSVATMKVVELKEEADVLVSEVYDPQNFVIQPASPGNAENLDKLSTSLSAFFQTYSPPAKPEVPPIGTLCCANFSQDQLWYRAQVMKISGSEVEVYFIDFGNTETVSAQSIAPCPSHLVDIPVCAVKCSLTDIVPAGKGWAPEARQFLLSICSEKLLQAKVSNAEPSGGNRLVHLFDSSGGEKVDVSASLIEQGYAVSASKANTILPQSCDISSVSLPATEIFNVLLSEAVSPSEMYVQLVTTEMAEKLNNLCAELNEYGSKSPPPSTSPPSKGSLLIAKFSADQCWYRAEVLSSARANCEVRFIDFGNTDTVDLVNTTACPEDLLSVPCLAVKCGLAGVSSPQPTWSEQAITAFRQLTCDRVMQAKVVSSSPLPLLKLRDASDVGIKVDQQLIQQGHAIGPTVVTTTSPQVSEIPLLTVSALKRVDLPTEVFHLVVSEVVSPAEMYVQLATPEMGEMLEKLTNDLHSKFSSASPKPLTSPPSKGTLCCAKFSVDNCWYRAEVLSSVGANCKVRFIDFGNKEAVDLKSMTSCPEELLSIPCLATKCGLAGVMSPSPNKDGWPEESVTFLKQLTAEKLMEAKVASSDPTLTIKLRDASKSDIIIAQQMIKHGHAKKPQVSLLGTPPKALPMSLPMSSILKQIDIPAGVFKLIISEVVSPAEMYFQLATSEVGEMLEKLTSDLHSKFNSAPPKPLTSPPSKGSLCLAKFSVDQCWYRAEVLSAVGASCEVRFVDFGNTDTVNLMNMAVCPEELLSVPCLAIRCGLAGVECPQPTWSTEAVSFLQQLVNEKLMKAKLVSTDPIPSLKLRDATKSDTAVAQQLIQQGYAVDPSSLDSSPSAAALKRVDLPTDVFQLVVSEVVSPAELYIQLATPEMAAMLDKLTSDLHDKFSSAAPKPLTSPPSKGSLKCAKFSADQCWYRAEVLSSVGTSCEVRFIDFGNWDVVDLVNMADCPEDLLSVPCLATQCRLAGVASPSSNKDCWPEESTSFLKHMTGEKLLRAKVIGADVSSKVPLLKLKDGAVDINKELIQRGCAQEL